jgi:hypothetical protein
MRNPDATRGSALPRQAGAGFPVMTSTDDKINWFYQTRKVERQIRTDHLIRCGPRCVWEALEAIDRGKPIDSVLEHFSQFTPAAYEGALYYFIDSDEVGQ